MSSIPPLGPTRPPSQSETSLQETQLAKELHSATAELIHSLRQVLINPDLAGNEQYLGHVSQAIQSLDQPSQKAASIGER